MEKEIEAYINSQPEPKRSEMHELHRWIRSENPNARLWFLDGKDSENKTVSNPNIGYGFQKRTYADGSTKEFYQVGMSANTSGISIYIMGISDKTYLKDTFGATLGKASITGYCIKFKKLSDIDLPTLKAAVEYGMSNE